MKGKSRKRSGGFQDGSKCGDALNVKGANFYRDARAVRQLKIREGGNPIRDKSGKVVVPAPFQGRNAPGTQDRVYADRSYWENTRSVKPDQLEAFREALNKSSKDPFAFVIQKRTLPMSFLKQEEKKVNYNLLSAESFETTFGPKARRKKPKVNFGCIEEFSENASKLLKAYDSKEKVHNQEAPILASETRDPYFSTGKSKRIWGELYKVIDSSDVIVEVLDARIPEETRCRKIEKYIKEETPHKHLILVLNKCDLLPTSIASQWVKHLSKEYPTIGFKSGISNSFGKGVLIALLRQFARLHSDRKQITVGFVGYPNTGKSSVINTLRKKRVCNVAPIPGETKVWQYITLTKSVYLLDCPGVVTHIPTDTCSDIVFRCVIRTENITDPDEYIQPLLDKIGRESFELTYDVHNWTNATELLTAISNKTGKLLKAGEPNIVAAAKMVLRDWYIGNIPYYTKLPNSQNDEVKIADTS